MRADVDGAARIARIAAEFAWTWTEADVPRFAMVADMGFIHEDAIGGVILRPDLAFDSLCFVSDDARLLDRCGGAGESIVDFEVVVASSASGEDDSPPLPATLHREFSTRLTTELGARSTPVPGERAEADYWRREKVVISLLYRETAVYLEITNPRYQRFNEETARAGGGAPISLG
ncbi:DUF6301 family protein [Nocardia noduli]|uniref:DUF6301 family protein n=1 Tax=Nocardia noduli TaxID=2815722 RepID=UPI001C2105E3|nr:DUF6301 family protein [Nocardia noduli]